MSETKENLLVSHWVCPACQGDCVIDESSGEQVVRLLSDGEFSFVELGVGENKKWGDCSRSSCRRAFTIVYRIVPVLDLNEIDLDNLLVLPDAVKAMKAHDPGAYSFIEHLQVLVKDAMKASDCMDNFLVQLAKRGVSFEKNGPRFDEKSRYRFVGADGKRRAIRAEKLDVLFTPAYLGHYWASETFRNQVQLKLNV